MSMKRLYRYLIHSADLVPPYVILALSLALTGLLTVFAFEQAHQDASVQFDRTSRQIVTSVRSRMDTYINTLIHTRSLFIASDDVTRQEFTKFVASLNLKERYPGNQGIGFAKKVPAKGVANIISSVRKEGFPDFKVWPMDPPREEYFPILFLEPFDWRNQRAFGYDMFSEPKRHAAMARAMATGHPAATELVVLVQETQADPQAGFLVYVPYYNPRMPTDTEEERNRALEGFIYSPFRSQDLFREIVRERTSDESPIEVEIYDGRVLDHHHLLFDSHAETADAPQFKPVFRDQIRLNIAGEEWTLIIKSLPGFAGAGAGPLPWIVLLSGIVISSLLYRWSLSNARYNSATLRNARQLREITDAMPALVSYVDPTDWTYRFVNRSYVDWTGNAREALEGHPMSTIQNGLFKRNREELDRVARGEHRAFETELLNFKSGLRKFRVDLIPDRTREGLLADGRMCFTIVANDITDLVKIAEQLREEKRTAELINSIGLSIRAHLQLPKLVQTVTEATTQLTHAQWGAFFYVKNEGNDSRVGVAAQGVAAERLIDAQRPLSSKDLDPFSKNSIRLTDLDSNPDLKAAQPFRSAGLPVRSFLSTPVISGSGQLIGVLAFGHSQAGAFKERAQSALEGIATQAAVAMDNARLYEALERSESGLRHYASTRSFLAEATRLLSSSLDRRESMTNLTRLLVPRLADACIVSFTEGEGNVRHVSTAQTSDVLAPVLNLEDADGVLSVVRTGETQFLQALPRPDQTSGPSIARGVSPRWSMALAAAGIKSYISVPIRSRDGVIGALTLMITSQDRSFNEGDLEFALDLADRASTAFENARLYEEARRVNRIKDEFLATLSHELRTPLNVIQGHAEILKTEAPPLGELNDSIDAIHRNARTQTQIVDDLLDVSSIITGKISFKSETLELADIVTASIDAIRFTAQAKGVSVKSDLEPGPTPVVGDSTRLQQVVWNLLSNAVKFTPRQGEIRIRLRRTDKKATVEVTDTGEGIDPEFLPFVFERFRQEDNTMTRRFGGLGLGLSIVRSLVELHGGSVDAHSEGRGRGSTFTVTLPLAPSAQRPWTQGPELQGDSRGLQPNGSRAGLQGARILVIDDEEETRKLVSRQLEKAGATVQTAPSAAEGFESYLLIRPDLIISDIGMPGEDGISFIRRVRESESASNRFTPALALTAYAREEDREKALASGYQAHLSKPIESQTLITAVERALRRTSSARIS